MPKTNERQIRPLSRNHYNSTISYLIREAGSKDPKKLLKYIQEKDVKDSTKFNYLNAIISLKKDGSEFQNDNIEAVKKARDDLRTKINEQNAKSNVSEKQKAVMDQIKMSDIHDVINRLKETKDKSYKDLEDYIILSLMVKEPVRNDLMDIRIVRKKTDLGKYNALYLPTKAGQPGIIKIVDHKSSSSKSGKPIVKELNTELTDDIRAFLKRSSDSGNIRQYLFQSRNGQPYTSSGFSHKFQRLFKKHLKIPFSSTVLRKIFWTDLMGEKEKQMKDSAEKMGHTSETVRKYYIAND